MIKLEEFVNEKLKVTKNSRSGNGIIVTTLRKFLAWFTGEPDYTINKFDIADRDFISSDKSMSKDDKTNFLYKCLDAAIYVTEEEKSTYDVSGLNGEVKVKLYDYSFEVGNITFSIDARIYNENELLSKNAEYFYKIVEKLKVSKNKPDTKFETTLNLFIREYFYIPDGTALYSNDVFYAIKDGVDLNDESDLFAMTIKKCFESDFNVFQNWVYKLNKSKIQVFETVLEYGKGIYSIKTKYEFDLDDKHVEFLAYFSDEDELISNVLSENITEKLKVSSKELVPFEDIDIAKFARALRKTGTIFIDKYTDELITLSNYKKKMYLYSFGLEHPSDPYPVEIEIGFKTDDDWFNNEYIKYITNIEELEELNKVLNGGDFKSLVEEIYNDIVQ